MSKHYIFTLIAVLAGCAGPAKLSVESDFLATIAELNITLARTAIAKKLSLSRFESPTHCHATLVTQWSDDASSRKGLASAKTRTPLAFSNIKSVSYVEAKDEVTPSGIVRWEEAIRIQFLSEDVRSETKVVFAQSSEELSREFSVEYIDVGVNKSSGTNEIEQLMTLLQKARSACVPNTPIKN